MIWIAYALAGMLFQAAFVELNRHFRVDGYRLNLWASIFAVLFLLPAIPFMAWPESRMFYIIAFASAAASSVGGVVQFSMAAKHNGRVAAMYMPVKAFLMFWLWLILDPSMLQTYAREPVKAAGVGIAFIVSVLSLVYLRRNDIGWRSFMIVAPLGALFAVSNILTKSVFEGDEILRWVLCFNFLFYVFMSLQMLPVVIARTRPEAPLFDWKVLRAGAAMAIFSILAFIGILGGIIAAPNPAYVGILQMLTPAVLLFYHKLIGHKDEADPLAGLGLVCGAVVLIISTQIL